MTSQIGVIADTHGFLHPRDTQEAKKLATRMKVLQKQYPSGADDLKGALTQAIDSFENKAGRQRILVQLPVLARGVTAVSAGTYADGTVTLPAGTGHVTITLAR